MTESKAKEKAIKWFRYNWSEIYTINSVDIIKKTIDIALQEQAQEIKEWLKVTFHFVKEEQEVIDRVFREKYTGKEEGKDV